LALLCQSPALDTEPTCLRRARKRQSSELSEFPERGAYPKELLALGIREYREVFFKPYRIIYRVMDKNVYVLLIVDGRRDMQSLLQRRLLDA
jgi:toxin ParE1/3/4